MQIALSDAIQQLRDELRKAILEGKDQEIIFTPNGIDIELGVTFSAEAKADGSLRLLAFLDLSAEAKANRESQHNQTVTVGRRQERSADQGAVGLSAKRSTEIEAPHVVDA